MQNELDIIEIIINYYTVVTGNHNYDFLLFDNKNHFLFLLKWYHFQDTQHL